MSGLEQQYVQETFASNWIAPLGPQVDAFAAEFAAAVGAPYALALSSGTAALHLALIHLGVGPGDEVLASTLTFSASANPVVYLGAKPVFIDSERASWNLDPALVVETIERKARGGQAAQGRDPGRARLPGSVRRKDPPRSGHSDDGGGDDHRGGPGRPEPGPSCSSRGIAASRSS